MDPNRIDAGRRLGSVVRHPACPVCDKVAQKSLKIAKKSLAQGVRTP
jgi:hypothetical protein